MKVRYVLAGTVGRYGGAWRYCYFVNQNMFWSEMLYPDALEARVALRKHVAYLRNKHGVES